MKRLLALMALCLVAIGCSGNDNAVISLPHPTAHTYRVAGFKPSTPVPPGKPTTVSFTIIQPNGKPLVHYATGAGPHVGVHLIFVRTDLSGIVHLHPPIGPDGNITQQVTFPSAGPWELLIDAYLPGSQTTLVNRNFQLYQPIDVSGPHRAKPMGAVRTSLNVDGYTFTIKDLPTLHVAQAQFMDVAVRGPSGQVPSFTPWFGALAHAIFFHPDNGRLDYFHTHICSPALALCTVKGAISGSSPTHGDLRVGMLFPVAGKWRLFLQCQIDGRVITAPFTLDVRP
jgi:hypothetical protein